MNKNTTKYKNYVFAAMFAALILMGTMFIQVPSVNGYVHIGDSFIYLAAAFLPMPFSVLAAGVGAGLADVLSGYMIYAPFTFVIKAVMAAFFSSKAEKLFTVRNIVAFVIAGIVNVVGYYITELIMYPQAGGFVATLVYGLHTIPGNLVQSLTASVIFVIASLAFDKMNLKKTLDKIA
ncbi:MAG: TIGR04002 family protein [Ruminococcaceae bacterium]|nr:TIGR04002 family protein [Oscillospiraceae bacterium]